MKALLYGQGACSLRRNWGASLYGFYWKQLWEMPVTKWVHGGNDREANFGFMWERATRAAHRWNGSIQRAGSCVQNYLRRRSDRKSGEGVSTVTSKSLTCGFKEGGNSL